MIIYRHTCTISNKSYIGQTRQLLAKRWKQHYNESRDVKRNNKFYNALRKYGTECWTHEILEEVSSVNLLNEREVYWIAFYDTFNNGYNSTSGGGQLMIICDEAKEKMRLAKLNKPRKEEHKLLIKLNSPDRTGKNNPNYGKKTSEKTKKLMSEANMGEKNHFYRKTHSDITKNKMRNAKLNKKIF